MLLFKNLTEIILLKDILHCNITSCSEKLFPTFLYTCGMLINWQPYWHCAGQCHSST